MSRPLDWETRALAWFRSLEGEQPGAVINAIGGPDQVKAQIFARLMVECREMSQAEEAAKAFQEEGLPLIREAFSFFTKK